MATTRTSRQGLIPSAGIKAPCVAATNANITLSGVQTIDGYLVAVGDRVLVTSQTDASENGIYVVSATEWTRSPDCNQALEIASGVLVAVENASGTSAIYKLTYSGSFVLGSSDLTVSVYPQLTILNEPNFASNSTTAAASQASIGTRIATLIADALSDDETLTDDSTIQAVTERAIKLYIAAQIAATTTLPSQTGNANEFVTTDGTDASFKDLSEFAIQYCRVAVTADDSIAASATEVITPGSLAATRDANGLFSSGVITAPFTGLCIAMGTIVQEPGAGAGLVPNHRVESSWLFDPSTSEAGSLSVGPLSAASDAFAVSLDDEIEPGATNLENDSTSDVYGDAANDESHYVYIFIRGGTF